MDTDLKQALLDGVLVPSEFEIPGAGQEARNALSMLEFPTSKTEDWKYTRVGRLVKQQFASPSLRPIELEQHRILGLDCDRMVFVNGIFDAANSSFNSNEVQLSDLHSAEVLPSELASLSKHSERIFEALNTAFPSNGMVLRIPKGVQMEKPLHVTHVCSGSGQLAQPRHFIHAEEGSQAEVLFSFVGENAEGCFVNNVLECFVAANAKLDIEVLQKETDKNFHINSTHVHQAQDSHFGINTFTLSGSFVRNDLNIRSNGHNSHSELNGLYILDDNQHVDNHSIVDHLQANCTSSELYKGVVNDKATAVFNGKVFVRQDAQKINAYQSNANILLSDDATVNSKPELEIYADDVKCSHGSTTGQLDEEALFYLRSRGIGKEKARDLLVKAFVADVLEKVGDDAVRTHLEQLIEEKLTR